MLRYHPAEDANRILNIVDTGSRGVVRGIERQVLAFKWQLLDLAPAALVDGLDALIGEGLLRQAGSAYRLTTAGYTRLCTPDLPEAADPRESRPRAGSSPPPSSPPAPSTDATPAATPAPAPATPLKTRAGNRPTEYGLRQRLLGVYAAQGLGRGDKLSQPDLERYWSVAGYRADELRSALDILLRDGYATQSRFFGKTSFRLEKEAGAYMAGRPAPDWLLVDAPPLEAAELARDSLPDDILCLVAVRAFQQDMGPLVDRAYGELDHLLGRFQIPEFARFHAFELLHRLGYAEPTTRRSLALNDTGLALLARTDDKGTQRAMQQSLRAIMAAADTDPSLSGDRR